MPNSVQYTGVRSFAFIPKKPGVTDEEFAAYWRRVKPQRSGALAVLFAPALGSLQAGLFTPGSLFSPSYGDPVKTAEHRTYQTIQGLSSRLSLPERPRILVVNPKFTNSPFSPVSGWVRMTGWTTGGFSARALAKRSSPAFWATSRLGEKPRKKSCSASSVPRNSRSRGDSAL